MEAFMEAQSSVKQRGVRAREREKSKVLGGRRGARVNLVGRKGAREEILVVFQTRLFLMGVEDGRFEAVSVWPH
jgi:hypothetical protein